VCNIKKQLVSTILGGESQIGGGRLPPYSPPINIGLGSQLQNMVNKVEKNLS